MKRLLSTYSGIILGAMYGLLMRIAFDVGFKGSGYHFADLFSITFIWVVPIIIGIIPMLFASETELLSYSYRIKTPVLTVFLFFLFCFWSGKEDIICIVIISIPFLLGAACGGILFGKIVSGYKKRNKAICSILFAPLLLGPVENSVSTPSKIYTVRSSIIINATPAKVWQNVVRVKPISETEYNKGFFNYAGIPRPLYAELSNDTINATRIGHFEGGLVFKETVIEWERNKKISFAIYIDSLPLKGNIFNRHILAGRHFKFLSASYTIKEIDASKTELTLSSSYQLDTKINFYGSFWGNELLMDFQNRLLDVIKHKCSLSG